MQKNSTFNMMRLRKNTDNNGVLNRNRSEYMPNNIRNNTGIFFSHPIVSNIEVPELGNKKVNETEQLSKNGRLRSKRVVSWHSMQSSNNSNITLLNGQLPYGPVGNGILLGKLSNISKGKGPK